MHIMRLNTIINIVFNCELEPVYEKVTGITSIISRMTNQ